MDVSTFLSGVSTSGSCSRRLHGIVLVIAMVAPFLLLVMPMLSNRRLHHLQSKHVSNIIKVTNIYDLSLQSKRLKLTPLGSKNGHISPLFHSLLILKICSTKQLFNLKNVCEFEASCSRVFLIWNAFE